MVRILGVEFWWIQHYFKICLYASRANIILRILPICPLVEPLSNFISSYVLHHINNKGFESLIVDNYANTILIRRAAECGAGCTAEFSSFGILSLF